MSPVVGGWQTEPQHHHQQQQQGAVPNSPPASECSSPPGSRTPTGYQTSAPSSHEGSPAPRRKVHQFPAGGGSAGGMVEVVSGQAPQNTAMWRSRPDPPRDGVVPPWANPDAQPPPPPTLVHNTLSPTSQRRQMKLAAPTSSAVEASPSPKHFNRPVPGTSPVTARRSLFRNNAQHRARSVDSLAKSPPWADHKLRQTPRNESPLSTSAKTKATSSLSLEKKEEFTVVSASSEQHVTVQEQSAVELSVGFSAPDVGLHKVVGVDQQLPSSLVTTIPAPESQSIPGSLLQDQSSPTPWRKNVHGRAASANVTPAHQQQPAPSPCGPPLTVSAVSDSVHTTTCVSAPPASQQAPWRRGPVEAVQLSQSSLDKSASTAPESASHEVTGIDSQPSWRKQRTKSRPTDTSEIPAGSTATTQFQAPSANVIISQSVPPAAATVNVGATTEALQISVAHTATTVESTHTARKSTSQVPVIGNSVKAAPAVTSNISPHLPTSQPAHSVSVGNAHQSTVSVSTSSSAVTSKDERISISPASISRVSPSTAVTPTLSTTTDLTHPKGVKPETGLPATPPEPPQRSDLRGASIKSKRDLNTSSAPPPTPISSQISAVPRHSAAGCIRETQVKKPDTVPDISQVSLTAKELAGAPSWSLPSQDRDSFSPTHAMPIPTPPTEPSANLLKSGGVTQSPRTALGDKNSEITLLQTDRAMKEPGPPPPPPPAAGVTMPLGINEADLIFPPPPNDIQEVTAGGLPPSMQELSEEELDAEDKNYVRESVTKRIKAFEKQASKEEENPPERRQPVARPVAPWVKKTSAGPVQHDTYWDMTSPEEPSGDAPIPAPAPPPPPLPAHTKVERTMSPTRPAQTKVPSGHTLRMHTLILPS